MFKEDWQKNFGILYFGQAISVATSKIIQMASVWYLIDITNSAAVLAFATLVGFLPQAFIGYFAGTIIDRYDKKRIIVLADLFIALVTLILFIHWTIEAPSIPFIYLILFFRSIGMAFHQPALQSLVPLIVPKKSLTKYAGLAKSFESISDLLSPALAAFFYTIIKVNFIMLFDVFGALVAMGVLMFVKTEREDTIREEYHYKSELKNGLVYLKAHRGLMSLLIISGLYAVIYFPIGTLFPLIAISHFNIGIEGSASIEIIFSLGTLAGALLLGIFGGKINKIFVYTLSIATYGFCLVIIGILPIELYIIFFFLAFIMGISIPYYHSVQTAIIQYNVTFEYLGRVLTLVSSFQRFLMPIGLILSSVLVEKIGIDQWFFYSGIATLLLVILCISFKSLHDLK